MWAAVYSVGTSHVLQQVSVLSVDVSLCIHLLQLWLIPAITGSRAGVNRLPLDHVMVGGNPTPVGTHSLRGETMMKHSLPNYCQHIAHAVSVLLLQAPAIGYSPTCELPLVRVGLLNMQVHPSTPVILISNNRIGSGAWQKTGHLMKQSLGLSICNTNRTCGLQRHEC